MTGKDDHTNQSRAPQGAGIFTDQLVEGAPTGEAQSAAKLLVEIGPVAVFFLTQWFSGRLFGVADEDRIFVATGVFMVATVASLIASRILFHRVPVMPLVSGALIIVFGGVTLWMQDEYYIKIKPTVINMIFASVLFASLYMENLFNMKKPVLQYVFEDAFRLTNEGWRILTLRWAVFFIFLALLNELVWRTTSTDFWTAFKFFGVFPLTVVFAVSQVGVLTRHKAD